MRAFVLSGGGNLGPLQVGALRALLENEIVPDMLVGCSAGALNAAFLAREFSVEQLDVLEKMWRSVRNQDVYPGGRVRAMWRFLSGKDSLYDNRKFYAFLQRWGTTPATTFHQFEKPRLYVTATRLRDGTLHVFGDNGGDRVLDSLMASTALAPMHPPWDVDGERYIDGGTVTPLPLRVALDRGAREIYSLHIVGPNELESEAGLIRGVVGTLRKSVSTLLRSQAQQDLEMARAQNRKGLITLRLSMENAPAPGDFSGEEEMFKIGYEQAILALRESKQAAKRSGDGEPSFVDRVRNVWSGLISGESDDSVTVLGESDRRVTG